jgi:hypothetical protein
MEKQTAVEWLIDQILVEYDTYFNEEGDLVDKPINQFFNAYKSSVNLIEYVKQAKEMEKQQIKNAHTHNRCINNQTYDCTIEAFYNAEQYYNETFGK